MYIQNLPINNGNSCSLSMNIEIVNNGTLTTNKQAGLTKQQT